ncbi:MAG: FG-GAP-like repeat-containing protein [Wenzhouxiangella sp.]|nr:FG-GAP-like repeat-containing protein [Wenzhouxiangella sp.]
MNRILWLLGITLLLCACDQSELETSASDLSEDLIERNNRGVALMGQYRNEEARQVFAALVAERPDWTDAEVNLAIAILNRQQEGDELVALEIVERILIDHPEHLRARYIAGLMRFYIGDTAQALAHLEQVLEAAPDDAHVAYFTAQAYSQLGQSESALELYERAIALDPYLRSAYYGAALAHRQLGEAAAAREQLGLYQRFENNPRAQLAEFVYTRKGPLAEALAVGQADEDAATHDPDGALFDPSLELLTLSPDLVAPSLTAADVLGNGRLDVLVAGGPEQDNWLVVQDENGWAARPDHPLAEIDSVNAALWGDFDNDGELDVLLCRAGENRLLSGQDWRVAAGGDDLVDPGLCRDGAVLDADHDGDLDIFMVSSDGPNELFNNNLNGSFRRLSLESEADLAGGARASRQVLALDFDADRDADLVILHADPPHQVLRNDRLWRYQNAAGFEALTTAPLLAVTAADFDASGQVELVTVDVDGQLQRWAPDAAGVWQARLLAEIEFDEPDSVALAALDFDGSGRAEVLVQHAGGFEVLGLNDAGQVRSRHVEAAPLLALAPVLLEPERGPALVGVVAGDAGHRLKLWPPGSGRHAFVAIAPSGMTDRGEGMRSNASGIGTGIMLRAGSRWSIFDTFDRHSGPGQSLQPLAIGLAGRDRADFVKLFWSDGVLQTEMDLAAGPVHRITELQRQLASCPVLFAWNGERHEFVSDLLGVAGIGFFQAPGRYSTPRPWEYFLFPEDSIAPRDGRYEIKIAEPMEEIAYIDSTRLHVVDLPPGWEVSLDERMFTGGGPEPTGEMVFYRSDSVLQPVRAIDDRGQDVTASVLENDFQAAPPGAPDLRFLGRLAADHVLTLEFGQVINPPGKRARLVASGWVEYPYSQTVFAAWQADAAYRPPSLEAFADGRWQPVFEHFGYPAGMPREMSLPLDALPPETTALRIRGNWEVYWDRIAVVHTESPEASEVHALTVAAARLARTGFARRDTLAQRLPYYDYSDRSPFWDTKYQTGFYTDFGPVELLVGDTDDAFAVFGPGEEVHFEFAAPAAPPEGWTRRVVLEVRGYAKDMDLYTNTGETVEPLPITPGLGDPAKREALHERFLNRFQGGR